MSSLLNDAMESCVMMHKITVDDPYGGDELVRWIDGASFKAAFALASSVEARIGQSQNLKDVYTVTTSRTKVLEYHDVFRRLRDGKVFRSTSDGDDNYTPRAAGLDMRVVSAEEYIPVSSPQKPSDGAPGG